MRSWPKTQDVKFVDQTACRLSFLCSVLPFTVGFSSLYKSLLILNSSGVCRVCCRRWKLHRISKLARLRQIERRNQENHLRLFRFDQRRRFRRSTLPTRPGHEKVTGRLWSKSRTFWWLVSSAAAPIHLNHIPETVTLIFHRHFLHILGNDYLGAFH